MSRRSKYNFGSLSVGETFSFPASESGRVRAAAFEYGKRRGLTFATRTVGDKVIVWRLA